MCSKLLKACKSKFHLNRWRSAIDAAFGLLLLYMIIVLMVTITIMTPALKQRALEWMASSTIHSLKPVPRVCANESCRRDYALQLHRSHVFPVPKIRHILWRNESVSSYFAKQLASWQRIHPDWTYVLWRDCDLEPFVAANFPMHLAKFKSLKQQIMRVDMVRYMLLFKFGGTYADLDYTLVRSLDDFRRFHTVVTREPEAHSLAITCQFWPIKPLASPAFMMSAAGHEFNWFMLEQLSRMQVNDSTHPLDFGGPFGLTRALEKYAAQQQLTNNSMETVYLPPSYSFYPYQNNSLRALAKHFRDIRYGGLYLCCNKIKKSNDTNMRRLQQVKNLTQLCSDVGNLDPITDSSQPIFAIHDLTKSSPFWGNNGLQVNEYVSNPVDIKNALPNLRLGAKFSCSN